MDKIFSLEKWNLNNFAFPLLFTCFLAFIAKSSLVGPLNNAVDDYFHISNGFNLDGKLSLSQGRWGQALLFYITSFFNLDYSGASPLFSMLYSLQIAFSIQLLIRSFNIKIDKWLEAFILATATLHPYFCEIFTFKVTMMALALSFSYPAMSIGYLLLSEKKVIRKIIGMTLIIWSLANYQVGLNVILIFIPFQFILVWEKEIDIYSTLKKVGTHVTLFIASVLAYFLSNMLLLKVIGIKSVSRATPIQISQLQERFNQIIDLYSQIFFKNEAISSSFAKWILILLLFILLGVVVKHFINKKRKLVLFIPFVFMIIVGALAILGPSSILSIWWPVPRILSGIGFFWALTILLLVFYSNQSKILYIPLFFILLSFTYNNNRVLSDQKRINFIDYNKANRIVSQIETLSNFKNKKLLIFQGNYAYSKGIGTNHMDMNISSFYPAWSRVQLLEFVSGYDFQTASYEEEKEIVEKFPERKSYPQQGSIFEYKDIIVIQL